MTAYPAHYDQWEAESQHLYLPEKVVTVWIPTGNIADKRSQHLYLPEKVVTRD